MNLKKLFSAEFKNPETPKKLFGFSAIIALFFIAFKAPLDPDLFWHLKTGELMWQYKVIPYIDWYSYTMSDFPWINHEWLAEILMYAIKNTFGWLGLSIFFAAITAFIFAWLIPKISRNLETKKSPFYAGFILSILGAITSSLVFGARPQVFSLLGAALILYIIKEYQINNKSRIIYLLPFIFLFWTNLHGGFIIGLSLLGIYLILDKNLSLPASRRPDAEWLKLYRPLAPEAWKKLSWVIILSIMATFINPYGTRIYTEVFNTFSDNYGHSMIQEWISINFQSAEGIIFSFYLIFLFIILSIAKKIDLLSFVLLPFLLFYSFQSARNIPIFILASLPVLIKNMEGFEEIFSSIMQKKLIAISLSALLIFYPPIINDLQNIAKTIYNKKELAKAGNFPSQEALDFLENYRAKNPGNMLNDYAWGGYLIANDKCQMTPNDKLTGQANDKKRQINCEPKVFIDGRMSFWKTPSQHILKDYADITRLENNAEELLEKYQIKIIFIQKDSFISRGLAFSGKWKKIYENDLAVIYEKE